MSAGVLGKLFKKKEDEEDFLAYDRGMGAGVPGPAGAGMPNLDTGLPSLSPPGIGGELAQKDIELITSKLDSLKITLDTIQQRLANVEARLAQLAQQTQQTAQQPQQSFGYGTQPQQQQETGWHF